jgi:hypothetical protein
MHVKAHLVMALGRLSSGPDFSECFAVVTTDVALFGTYFADDKYLDKLRDLGKLFSPWESNGLAN